MYYPVWDWAYKRYLAANQKVTHEVVTAGFLLSLSHVILHLEIAGLVWFFLQYIEHAAIDKLCKHFFDVILVRDRTWAINFWNFNLVKRVELVK